MTDVAAVDAWSADLPPLAELVASLGDVDDEADPDDQVVDSMDIDQITLTLAIELEVRDADTERPRVTGSTPTQWTETTVLPVFHRLSMRVARAPDG
ncbi:MAG TPA: hypothetical protein VGQ52_18435 [Gemmatimonadaceae bacterium]|nr:hypothetical protein [Gemmatimonadaceae bacterium]